MSSSVQKVGQVKVLDVVASDDVRVHFTHKRRPFLKAQNTLIRVIFIRVSKFYEADDNVRVYFMHRLFL